MQYGANHAQLGAWHPASATHVNEVQHKRTKTGGTLTTTRYAPPPGYITPVAQAPAYANWPYAAQAYNPQQAYYGAYAQTAPYTTYPAPYAQYYQQQAYYAQAGQSVPQPHATTPYPHQDAPLSFDFAAHARQNSVSTNSVDVKSQGPNDELDESHEDYCEFTRPCYYASAESEIVKELSIGLVHMRTAVPANKALPASWDEANAIALVQSAPEKHDPTRCVSAYHDEASKANELMAVKDSNIWTRVKDDIIFKLFSLTTTELISIESMRRVYRNRVDQAWLDAKPDLKRSRRDAQRSVSAQNNKRIFSQTDAAKEARTNGKRHRQEETRAPALTQDEILARLGVTGTAKPVTLPQIPMPQTAKFPSNGNRSISVEPPAQVQPEDVSDDRSEQMELDSSPSSPQTPNDKQGVGSANNPQRDNKRSYDQSSFEQQEKDPDDEHQQKRRK